MCGRIGWLNAEYIVERAVPTDVVDAVHPVAAAVGVPQRLAGLGDPAAAEQRHGKAPARRFFQQRALQAAAALERPARGHQRWLQRRAPNGPRRQEVPLAQYNTHPLDEKLLPPSAATEETLTRNCHVCNNNTRFVCYFNKIHLELSKYRCHSWANVPRMKRLFGARDGARAAARARARAPPAPRPRCACARPSAVGRAGRHCRRLRCRERPSPSDPSMFSSFKILMLYHHIRFICHYF